MRATLILLCVLAVVVAAEYNNDEYKAENFDARPKRGVVEVELDDEGRPLGSAEDVKRVRRQFGGFGGRGFGGGYYPGFGGGGFGYPGFGGFHGGHHHHGHHGGFGGGFFG